MRNVSGSNPDLTSTFYHCHSPVTLWVHSLYSVDWFSTQVGQNKGKSMTPLLNWKICFKLKRPIGSWIIIIIIKLNVFPKTVLNKITTCYNNRFSDIESITIHYINYCVNVGIRLSTLKLRKMKLSEALDIPAWTTVLILLNMHSFWTTK